jgi:phosphonate transport system substrate-binding protein
LVQRRTYAEINSLIASGDVDMAFVCTSAYVAGHGRAEMELLVIPEIDGESVYYSSLIVPTDGTAQSITDLEGKIFAFTDPMSNTGRVYPSFLLQQMGENPDTFFADSFFTYSHDRAIGAVADGLADGAAVDSLVLDYALARDPALADRVRIIHQSPAFGIPPVVVPAGIAPRLRAQLEALLLGLDSVPAGAFVLAQLGVDRFVPGDDAAYDGVRALVAATGIDG